MRIVQILLPDATPRERRLQALDAGALAGRADVRTEDVPNGGVAILQSLVATEHDVAHVYGPRVLPPAVTAAIALPMVASTVTRRSRIPWRKARQPDVVLGSSPDLSVPDAVAPGYFAISSRAMPTSFRIGCAAGTRGGRAIAEGTRHRIERFRDDIRWMFFDEIPPPEEMSLLNAWIDPEPSGEGEESGVAEALAAGRAVVAAATAPNRERLEAGRAGFLVPPGDPNETAHAVLAALFKPELRDPKIARGKAKAEAWRPERRAERLLAIYERLRR